MNVTSAIPEQAIVHPVAGDSHSLAPAALSAGPVSELEAAARAFEALPVALAILDRQGRLVVANANARAEPELLGSLLRGGSQLARRALETNAPSGTTQPRIAGPLWLVAAPLALPERPADLVVITAMDPASPHPVSLRLIAELCGLTPAEAQTAKLVLAGNSPKTIARLLGVSLATVKTHLHRVFAKTGTSGQPDLARRLARILPPCAVPECPTTASGAPMAEMAGMPELREQVGRILDSPDHPG